MNNLSGVQEKGQDGITNLKHEIRELEKDTFYCLQRDDKKSNNAVNDCMAGFCGRQLSGFCGMSDPEQKIDVTLEGKRKSLPILRETLVPGTEIHFDLKIDSSLCAYTIEDIMECNAGIQRHLSNQYFYSRFRRNIEEENAVFLGGGCGYVSKTVMYAMLERMQFG